MTAGRSVVDARVVELLVEQRIRQAESPLSRLGPRELEVLKEMAVGKTNAVIAESLHLSEPAIEKYVNAIFAKLGLSEERKISRRVVARPGLPARPRPADLTRPHLVTRLTEQAESAKMLCPAIHLPSGDVSQLHHRRAVATGLAGVLSDDRQAR